MKFAFIIDTSPLMQLKRSVIESDQKQDAPNSQKKLSCQSGMTYFEQSVYAIELFVNQRKKQESQGRADKYLLALTASNTFSNCPVESEQAESKQSAEDILMGPSALSERSQEMGTLILSGLQHPLSHFMAQLHNLRNPRRHSKIKRSLLDVMSALNAKRFATGADNRLKGIQL